MAQDTAPITGLCIVAGRAPPGYTVIEKCVDKPDEANLWSSGQLFSKKAKRLLCITRQYPLDNGRLNNVLVSMVLVDEKDPTPDGYSLMSFTIDTQEPATCKKVIAVRMVPRSAAREAICEIVFHSKNRKLLSPYQPVGEVGNLLIGYRMALVPQPSMVMQPANFMPFAYGSGMPGPAGYSIQPSAMPFQQPAVPQQALPYPISPRAQVQPLGTAAPTNPAEVTFTGATTTSNRRLQHQTSQQGSVFKSGPLADVPFELHAGLKETSSFSQLCAPISFRFRSANDLQREYNYSFTTEESAAARVVRQ